MRRVVLIIDDSEPIHRLVKAILASEPIDVHSATDPEYGMVLAASERPDLILLDLDMPKTHGFEVCEMLKADPATAGCPIMFLTSASATADKVEGLALGAHDFVTKPFDHDELRARVKASLRTTKVIRSLEEQSLIDPTTGLGNKKMLSQRLKAEFALRVRVDNPLAIIHLEIDQFRSIIQYHGHTVADPILKSVAATLTSNCPTENVVCRVDEDAYTILAPASSVAQAEALAGKLARAISTMAFTVRPRTIMDSDTLRLTCSIGVAVSSDQYDRTVTVRAGNAAYAAKISGGNTLRVDQSLKLAA